MFLFSTLKKTLFATEEQQPAELDALSPEFPSPPSTLGSIPPPLPHTEGIDLHDDMVDEFLDALEAEQKAAVTALVSTSSLSPPSLPSSLYLPPLPSPHYFSSLPSIPQFPLSFLSTLHHSVNLGR
jgi:hypothetical protein